MKTIIAVLLACVIATAGIMTFAQGVEIDCGDDLIILDGIDVQFLNVSAQDVHYVSVLGIDEFDPVLAVFNQQQFGSCNDNSVEASGIYVDLPATGEIFESEFNSQMEFTNNTFMRVVVGEYDDFGGEAVLMVEGLTMDGQPDRIDVVVTESMIESQIPLTFYALPVTEDLDLTMALVDDNGVPLLADNSEPVECDDAGDNDLCWGAHVPLLDAYTNVSDTRITEGTVISPMLTIPLTPDDAGSIVPVQIGISELDEAGVTGEYVFLMYYGVGEVGLADGLAEVEETETGTSLFCDEIPMLSNPIELSIPQLDSGITVNLMSQGFGNPIMADMIDDTRGTCYITLGTLDEQSAQLPLAGMLFPSESNTDVDIITESARLLTGLAGNEAGSYLIAIDGLQLLSPEDSNVVSLSVTEDMVASQEPVVAYMMARDNVLNPQLTLVSAEQEPLLDSTEAVISCVHTSLPNQCWGDYGEMSNANITLGFDNSIQGINSDVMLSIPLSEDMIGTALNFMATASDETFGDYVMLLYVSSGVFEDEPIAEETETPESEVDSELGGD